jgi:uncharacterized OsmC-like protein
MVEITAELQEGLRISLSNGRHTWASDEPLDKGGEETGPSPYELLLGSLAACTLITLVLYARHKGIGLETASASYQHQKVSGAEGSDRKGLVDRLTSQVTIGGDFDDAQRDRLAQIVSRCPVHRTLESDIELVDEVEFL